MCRAILSPAGGDQWAAEFVEITTKTVGINEIIATKGLDRLRTSTSFPPDGMADEFAARPSRQAIRGPLRETE